MAKKSKPKPSINDHRKQGQLPIRTNALYLSSESLNIYLTYDQAIQAATNLLKKAELIKGDDTLAVQVWAKKGSKKLNFGVDSKVKRGAEKAWD